MTGGVVKPLRQKPVDSSSREHMLLGKKTSPGSSKSHYLHTKIARYGCSLSENSSLAKETM